MATVLLTFTGTQAGFSLKGSGTATINWGGARSGDSQTEAVLLSLTTSKTLKHTYTKGTYTITITVPTTGTITHLSCSDNSLTSLNVSNNSALIELLCYNNNLTSLNVSGLNKLQTLNCRNNNLNTLALDNLFKTLNSATNIDSKNLYILDNPGVSGCTVKTATDKGWTVDSAPVLKSLLNTTLNTAILKTATAVSTATPVFTAVTPTSVVPGVSGIVTTTVSGVSLNKSVLSLGVGGSETLVASVVPSTAKTLMLWSSSNSAKVAVDAFGKVTVPSSASAGTAVITVTTVTGAKTATCTVTVTESAPVLDGNTYKGSRWTSGKLTPTTIGTSHGPALAEYAGKLYMAWKGIEGDERLWFSYFDGSNWSSPIVGPGCTSCRPALAVYKGKLYMAWKGMGTDQNIWFSCLDGTNTWSTQQQAKDTNGNVFNTSHSPALAVYKNRLYIAWKGMNTDSSIWCSTFNDTARNWIIGKAVPGVGTSCGPALAVYRGKFERPADDRLYIAWKGIGTDERIWFSCFNGTTWTDQQSVPGVGTSCGPALATYSKYWEHAKSFDPYYKDLYMVWKGSSTGNNNSNDARIWQTIWYKATSYNNDDPRKLKCDPDFGEGWMPQKLISESVKTSDVPALAVFNGKLFMAWKQADSSRIYFSYLETGSDVVVRNIFEKTRPGQPVVRPEDLVVLRIETQNMKLVNQLNPGSNKYVPMLCRDNLSMPAYLILHFPPQSFAEETFYQTPSTFSAEEDLSEYQKNFYEENPGKVNAPAAVVSEFPLPVRARIAHESRLVFKVPNNFQPVEYSLTSVLSACCDLELKVSEAAGCTQLGSSNGPLPELPDATTTSIEMPWRLILSPNSSGRWRHTSKLVYSATNHTELWHSRLVTPHADGTEIEPPYPDTERTLRAIWALSGMGTEIAKNDDGTVPVPMRSNKPTSTHLPSPASNPFLTTLNNFDRYQFVPLSSNFNISNYKPDPIDTNMMMLSSLGGWLDSRGAWDPSKVGFSVEEWVHRATMGRDHYVRVVYRGFLFPFGHRVSLVKVSERKFHNVIEGNPAYLRQRMFIVVREKERTFTDTSFINAKTNGNDDGYCLSRKFPFTSVKLLTEKTPDLYDPNAPEYSVGTGEGTETYEQKMFWPHLTKNMPFRFQCVATDLEGRQVLFDLPLIFVDNTLASPHDVNNKPLVNGTDGAVDYAKKAMGAYQCKNSKWFEYNKVDFKLQRVALASRSKAGDTSVLTKTITFGGFTEENNNSLQVYSSCGIPGEELTRPIWVPQVEEIDARIESIAHLSGTQETHTLEFNKEYLRVGFNSVVPPWNKGEVFVDVLSGPSLDFSSQGDKSGGFIQPNLTPKALSRLAGPVMSNVDNFIRGYMDEGAGFPKLGESISGLPMPLLFGCIPLGNLIQKADDVVNNLECVPKFISEAGTALESVINDLKRLQEFIADLPEQSMRIATAALQAFKPTLSDLSEQANVCTYSQKKNVDDAVKGMLEKIVNVRGALVPNIDEGNPIWPTWTEFISCVNTLDVNNLKNAANTLKDNNDPNFAGLPAGLKQSISNTAQQIIALLNQIKSQDGLVALATSGKSLSDKFNSLNFSNPSSWSGILKDPIGKFQEALDKTDLLDGAPRNTINTALNAVKVVLDTIDSLMGDELTVRFDWNPKIKSYPTTDPLFRVNDEKGLLVAVEAKVKKNGKSNPNISVNCSLKHFDLVLFGSKTSFIELNFEKIEFSVDSAAKMDVDVRLSDVKFLGPLSFVETLRDLIPLDGFSDPPHLDITSKGIDASYGISLPAITCGMLNISNVSLAAGFTVPFIGQPMSVRFNFCRREQPFTLTVTLFGGGGWFGIVLDPNGVQMIEAGFEFGAAISINLGVASGGVYVMAGFYFRIEPQNQALVVVLAGYFRLGGHVSVLGLITASLELYLEMRYESNSGKCVGSAQLTIEVSIAFFSKSVTIRCERKFAGSNGDPTIRQILGYHPKECMLEQCGLENCQPDKWSLEDELVHITEKTSYAWRDYIEAFTMEEYM